MTTNKNFVEIPPNFEERFPGATRTATEAAMKLVRTADLLIRRIGELVEPFGLSPSSGLVLGILADAGTPLPPHQIAERLIISRATVTGLLDSLEKRGYLRRAPHSSDRRMLLIELTDEGRRVAHEFRVVVHRQQNEWLGVLSKSEQDQLIEALQRLEAVLADAKVR